ncbi:nucleotide-diphospho-sugar transferase family protein [Rhynchospora pubera]|uniref:Nucleotide-diphospho-sugar transferase family protein n=1 Tax=Rhynchospora pubera TaxID=906938 RepID=A0AAV8E411_9POAL|nr:nucleotide-diphospho-sugar transferase family protein [Rhynchospora pubera]
MSYKSIEKRKTPIFLYGLTIFLAAVLFVSMFFPDSKIPLDRLRRDWLGAKEQGATTEEMEKLCTKNLVPPQPQESHHDDFAMMVQKAATDDKRVILTEVNEAFAAPNSMLDLFLESFHNGEDNITHHLDHLIIVAMDKKAFEKCKSVHHYCYLHEDLGSDLSSENLFMSKPYIDLVWTKVRLWQLILEQGYSFLFTDIDVMWFRDPFRHISLYADLTIATDRFFGNPEDHGNNPNTGMVYATPTRKNIEVIKYWIEARQRFPTTNEQTVYDNIKYELASKFNLKIQYVSTEYWGNFCQLHKDFTKLSTFHPCCVIGLKMKIAQIKNMTEEWKMYKSNNLKS